MRLPWRFGLFRIYAVLLIDFLCTDLSLSAEATLKLYQKRWQVEGDNLYLKEVLGLGDFRLQSFEAIQNWLVFKVQRQFLAKLQHLIHL